MSYLKTDESGLQGMFSDITKRLAVLEQNSQQKTIDTRCLGEIMERIRKLEFRDSEPQQPPQPTPAKGMTALEAIIWCAQNPGQKAWDKDGDWVSFSKTGVLEGVTIHPKYEPYSTVEFPKLQPTQMTALQALQWCAANVGEPVWDKKGHTHRVMKDNAGCHGHSSDIKRDECRVSPGEMP
jgi:hypothetical protein